MGKAPEYTQGFNPHSLSAGEGNPGSNAGICHSCGRAEGEMPIPFWALGLGPASSSIIHNLDPEAGTGTWAF